MSDDSIGQFFASTRERLREHRETFRNRLVVLTESVLPELTRARQNKQEADLVLAADFNVFDFICPDENRLSDILAWLLEPSGSHGQRDAFLQQLLAVLSLPQQLACSNVRVNREEATTYLPNPRRRIDILIDSGGVAGIGIENKPWAPESLNQVSDYRTYLKTKYDDRWALLYLSGDGSRPSSVPVADLVELERKKQFRVVSYAGELCHWLEACQQVCKAEKVRLFLADFLGYVRRRFRTSVVDWRIV